MTCIRNPGLLVLKHLHRVKQGEFTCQNPKSSPTELKWAMTNLKQSPLFDSQRMMTRQSGRWEELYLHLFISKAKKVYCSSIYVIDYFYSRVPISPEVDRSTTGWHSFRERQSLAADTERHFVESFRKQKLNEFLSICGVCFLPIYSILQIKVSYYWHEVTADVQFGLSLALLLWIVKIEHFTTGMVLDELWTELANLNRNIDVIL